MSVILEATPTPTAQAALSPRARVQRRAWPVLRPHIDEELFAVIGSLRACPASALHRLVLHKHFKGEHGSCARHISALVEARYLQRYPITGTRYVVLHLTRRALQVFPSIAQRFSDHVTKMPGDDVAAWGHMKATLLAAFVADGYAIGDGPGALLVLRRHLIDAQRARIIDAKRECIDDVRQQGRQLTRLEQTLTLLRTTPALLPDMEATCGCPVPTVNATTKACSTCAQAFTRRPLAVSWCCTRSGNASSWSRWRAGRGRGSSGRRRRWRASKPSSTATGGGAAAQMQLARSAE